MQKNEKIKSFCTVMQKFINPYLHKRDRSYSNDFSLKRPRIFIFQKILATCNLLVVESLHNRDKNFLLSFTVKKQKK